MTVRVALRLSEVGFVEAVTVTWTACVSGAKPVALAVILTVPMVTPVTCGLDEATVEPAATKTLAVTVAIDVLLLTKFTVTPPVGAGLERLKARLLVWAGATIKPVARLISLLVTVTPVVAVG